MRGFTIAALGVSLIQAFTANAQIPAFPGAQGYGSHATGGRGGDVYIVTNLNASGVGSFADAVTTAPPSGRTIVFAVSGHIRLPSGSGGGLSIANSKITVAGQTAPGDGVCFWNNTMNLSGDDLVLRHLRWRYGKQAAGGDAVDINGSQRIILDHCDVMFSTDENLSSFGTPPEYFTFQWSINAWGLQPHSAGGLWELDHATSHHSLWANNHTRNPKVIAPSVFDWANNVTFGWNNEFNMAEDPVGGGGYVHRVNVRGSTFVHGGSTSEAIVGGGTNSDGSNKFKLHMSDSALDGNNNGVLDVSRTDYQMAPAASYEQTATAWPQTVDGVSGGTAIGVPVTVDARLTGYKKVLSQSGALRMEYDAARPLRDEITQLCVTRVAAQQRGIITDPLELGLSTGTAFAALNSAPAPTDTDADGMPDIWEDALGMNAALASHNTVFASSGGIITGVTFFPANTPAGYTHLEEYLHFKTEPHALVPKNTVASPSFVDVDLSRYTSGFTSSPVFTLANVTGGGATQSGTGGKIVRFTPTADVFFGRAWFDFTVTDSAGSAWTQRFCVLESATPIPRDLVWVGNGAMNPWDTTTAVWSRTGLATTFDNGDSVTLGDTGSDTPTLALSGMIQPAAVLVDASARNYTLTGGTFTGAMALTKRGSGTLTFRSNHTHTGGTTIEDGALVLGLVGTTANSTGNVGSGTLSLLGDATVTNAWYGTQLPLSAPIAVPAGAVPVLSSGRNIRISGALTGEGTLTLVNQTVTGSTFDLSGPWAAFAGTLRFTYAGTSAGIRAIFNGGSFNGFGGATLDLGGGNSLNPVTNSSGNIFNMGSLTSTAANAIMNGGTAGAPTYVIGVLNASTTFAGKFQGNAKLTKVGIGTLTLSGANTHSGATTISAGTLQIGAGAATGTLGTGAMTNDATLHFHRSDTALVVPNAIGGSGELEFGVTSGGTLGAETTLSGPNTFTGAVSVHSGGVRITRSDALGSGAKTVTMTNGTNGSPRLILDGSAGNIALPASVSFITSNTSTTYPAIVNEAGNNTIAGNFSLMSGGGSTRIRVDAGTLALTGQFTPAVSGRTLQLDGAGSGTFSGALKNAANTVALEKFGAGTWTLTGTGHTYSGGTTISAGKLALTGTLASSVTASGGTFAPQGTPGTSGGVSIASGGRLEVHPASDTLTVAGSVTLAGALDIVAAPGHVAGTTFIVVNKTSAGAVSGTFFGKPEGSAFSAGGYVWLISYVGGDGNDTTLKLTTAQQSWRYTNFGTVQNTGTAADLFDANGDGELNLMEFATAQNPNAATTTAPALVKNGATLVFNYTRSLAALSDGVTFTAEWRDDLASGAWSNAGVIEQILSDNGTVQTVKASVAAGAGSRFVRLKVSKP